MAADQRKKRLTASSFIACTSRDQYRVNRKKLLDQQHNLNMRPNITLEWDNGKKSVVSKRNQIGIARRHLIPFIEPTPHGPSILADVISIPQEIFDLESLRNVLSYEVWQGHLSDKERKFLSQFLPKESEPDTIVRDLLAGDNFHFGNPFVKWGASLCIGKLHPDNLLLEEQHLKIVKKGYYSHLQKYHNDMIENLQIWKNKWFSCKDPGLDTQQNIWRKHGAQSMLQSEAGSYGTEELIVATPESCSWINSEVVYSSDNQNSGMYNEESQRRKDLLNKLSDCSNEPKGTAAPRKGEKIHKRNIQKADGAKYMSYIKVSKQQHERVKNCMKHAGNSIQPKSLNNVLGSIDTLNVQPYERFVEEERKKLHNHWLKLATEDIPEGFVNWERRQCQRRELVQSLGEELGQRLGHQLVSLVVENQHFQNKQLRLSEDIEQEILPSITIESVEELTDDLVQEQSDNEEAMDEMTTDIKDEKEIETENIFKHQIDHVAAVIEDDNVADHVIIQDHNEQQIASLSNKARSTTVTQSNSSLLQDQDQDQDQHQQPIDSLNCNSHGNSMEMESDCGSACAKPNGDPPIVSQYPGNLNQVDIPVNQGDLLPSTCDVWPVADVRGSYYQSTASRAGYMSSHELPIGHPQFIPGQVQMLDLENDGHGKNAGNETLDRQPEDISFFSSYSNQDRNELLQSLFKGQSNMPYHQQQKPTSLEFQPGHDIMMEAGQFAELREQVHPSLQLDPRQKKLNDLYLSQNIQETIYAGGPFPMPRQEELPVNIHDWAGISKARMPVPSQPHMSSGELSQNWRRGENGTQDGWPSFEIAVGVSHSLGSGSNSDQTLFSVISECNELRPRSSYESVGSTELLMQAGNYSGIGGGIPLSSNFLQQSPNRLNYLSSHDTNAGIKMNNLGWIGMPQQNSGMQGSIGKPFLRSWNQQG